MQYSSGSLVNAGIIEQRIHVMEPVAMVAIMGHALRFHLLAEVGFHHVDAKLEQRLVRITPKRIGVRMSEIDET